MSDKKTITVTVEGGAHSGKSTIIAIVEQALKDQGFENVEVKMIADEPGVGFKALPVAVARTRIAKVVIQEKMLVEEKQTSGSASLSAGMDYQANARL